MSSFYKKSFLILLILFLLGMAYITYKSLFGLVPELGMGREVLAAALGALFVVLATGIQLYQQTDMEIERHKKQKTYEARFECYKALLNTKTQFNSREMTAELVENVRSLMLQAHLVCEQSETFEKLNIFYKIVSTLNESRETKSSSRLSEEHSEVLADSYENLAAFLMLDLKDGYKNLQGPEIDKVKESRKWFDDWCDRNQPTQNDPRQGPNSEKYRRNTDKVVFKGVAYTKKLYVYKVLENYLRINSDISFTKFKNSYTEKALNSIDGFNEDDRKQFTGANPLWLIKASAEAKKRASKEGDRWARYWITEDMLLVFSDGTEIAVRNGQDKNSIPAFQKWCHHVGIPCD